MLLEDVAAQLDDAQRWFQLYWWADRELAETLPFTGLPALLERSSSRWTRSPSAWRYCDLRNGYLPFLSGQGLAQFFSDPLFRERLDAAPEDDVQTALMMAAAFPSGSTWLDLEWLRARTTLPILVKGVLDAPRTRAALRSTRR